MHNFAKLSRRRFLAASGVSIALPHLESFAAAPAAAPTRFVALYFPNGVYPDAWQSRATETGLKFDGTLAPLQQFSSQAVTFSGLNHPLGGHLGQTSGFLSGCDLKLNEQGQIASGTSLDQMIARKIGGETYLPSLPLGMEPPSQGAFGDRPRSFGNSISWTSPTSKIEPQINPQLAFDMVFHGQTTAGRQAAARQKRLIDHVWKDAKTLSSKVSQLDRRKLDQYFDSVRDVEAKLEKAIHPPEKSWHPPANPKRHRPEQAGIPASYPEQMKLLMDILVLALQTDSTRVATFVLGHSISRVVYDFASPKIKANHHDLSHHRNDPNKIAHYKLVTEWFASQTAYLLGRMHAIDEGDGSLLDHSVVMFGSGMKDGNTHEPINVPLALFGSGSGRLRTQQHVDCPKNSQLADVHLTLLRAFDIEAESFNGVTQQTVTQLLR